MASNLVKKNANKSVMEVLRRIDRGQLLNDVDKALVAIAAGIEENNGGKGDITIKIKVGAKAKSDALEISGDVKFTVPVRKRTSAIMFFDPDAGEFAYACTSVEQHLHQKSLPARMSSRQLQ